MAIKLADRYPGKTAGTNTEYPLGQARNVTVPGDGTGTPWEAAIVNDDQGFKQALLEAADITPSGSPDTAVNSQYLQALLALFMGSDVFSGSVTSSTGTLRFKVSPTRTAIIKWGTFTTNNSISVGYPQYVPITELTNSVSFAVLSEDGANSTGTENASMDWQRTTKDQLAVYSNYVGICKYFLIGY